jgi:hypothetical protein
MDYAIDLVKIWKDYLDENEIDITIYFIIFKLYNN